MVIQSFVTGCQIQLNVRVSLLNGLDAFGATDDIHDNDFFAAMFLQTVNGRHKAAAGGQHRVNQEGNPVADIFR